MSKDEERAMNEARKKWWDGLGPKPHWRTTTDVCFNAGWEACEKHMRSSTRDLYYKCPGCGEFLAIPIKPHYCNVGLHVSSALTHADVEAWPIEKLREAVAVEVCGAKDDQDGYGWRFPGRGYPTPPYGMWIKQSNFKPDEDPAHNWMFIKAMEEKGWRREIKVFNAADGSGLYSRVRWLHPEKVAMGWLDFTDDELLKTCLAALYAVRGLW